MDSETGREGVTPSRDQAMEKNVRSQDKSPFVRINRMTRKKVVSVEVFNMK